MPNPIPSIDVIVVLWNHARFVEFMMDGLARVDYPREALTVHIVDNASTDGGIDAVKAYLATHGEVLPKTLIYEPGKNLGFAGGNNLIMRSSTADYVYLCNPDASFERDTLKEAVSAAESRPNAGSIQSLQVIAEDPSKICSAGNRIHFAGFGYCDGYRDSVDQAPKDIMPIAYASGASVLYRMSALKEVGFFDEELFAYHEDLDLGWRLLIAGYDNLLAPKSVIKHHFEFSRSIKKWYWMERNRGIVLLALYRAWTIVLLAPAVLGIEIATWLFAIKGGWVKEKGRADAWFFHAASWRYLLKKRREVARTRRVTSHEWSPPRAKPRGVARGDREILRLFVSDIAHQEIDNAFMTRVANPLMKAYFAVLKALS